MEEAGRDVGGAMVALLGASVEAATEIAEDRRAAGGQLWVANINAPGQIVMAGAVPDIEWLKDAARNVGIRRTIELKVSGAFHTPLIEAAADELEKALAEVSFRTPRFPVYSNVTAQPMDDLPATLREQLLAPVLFADSLRAMAEAGVDTFIHVGPGNVTASLAARTVPDAMTHVVQSLDDVTDVALALNVV
jgi:[acyl-carrier-protein] S-malonyltransferase